ncbi:MAG: 30S ribosomal protein S9 [Candidatus Omnitrophica bacterium]|nr:30S ribosomal protein S9 [Candidatus Omnitrophota bacterium]
MAEQVQYIATGRRKNSIARVRIMSGDGKVTINKRPFNAYFPRESNRLIIMQPLELVSLQPKIDVFANVNGGGLSGQAGAVKLGIARALVKMDAGLKSAIKKAGFLERDARKRERKKYGRKRARRRFQFTKR